MKEGWEIRKLGEVCRFINGRAYRKNELLNTGKYPVLRVGNFFTNRQWYYSDLELEEDKYCDNGDLLYAWSASFGPRIWEGGKVIYHYHIWKVVPDSKAVSKEFLFHLLEWDTENLKKAHGTGTTMMHVGKGSIETRLVPVPPLPEQHRLVSILDEAFAAIDEAKASVQKKLSNAKELFQSELNRIFSQKGEGWVEAKLGEVCVGFQYGTSAKSKNAGKVPVLGMGNIQDGQIVWDRLVYATDEREIEKYLLRSNDVLFNRTNSTELVGKSAIYKSERPAIFAGYLIRVIRKEDQLDADFLNYYLNSDKTRAYGFSVMISSVSQANISSSKLKEYPIRLPGIETQRRVVNQLDALHRQTKKLESLYSQKLSHLEALKRSILQKAFRGELTKPLLVDEAAA